MYRVKRAKFPQDLDAVLAIYREYVSTTSADLAFQNNEQDFLQLAQTYSSPESQIFLCLNDKQILGCAAFKRYTKDICEMKRVYVRPQARGQGLGAKLVTQAVRTARAVGYKKICLDVLPEFEVAYRVYQSLGFKPHPPITQNPVLGTRYLALTL